MSNSNRIKVKVYWRREDSKTYIEIPINQGKEGRPWFMFQRILEIAFLKKWFIPWQVFSYIWVRDSRRIKEELKDIDKLIELKRVQNGN